MSTLSVTLLLDGGIDFHYAIPLGLSSLDHSRKKEKKVIYKIIVKKPVWWIL